eukprot:CAMPEP_0117650480 /NCGR_PEP_ID=MMETSP0804-20121206/1560_1 /TAXON_ID=1074897 /ORGANISM="Tetraselmis astigmatica, Strain CCMP880" /LENGTH=124 /DNA_ID=CAMNT_0005456351 /DNA_START=150 /DNA_END=522 /DNA_ORIENTATION=+
MPRLLASSHSDEIDGSSNVKIVLTSCCLDIIILEELASTQQMLQALEEEPPVALHKEAEALPCYVRGQEAGKAPRLYPGDGMWDVRRAAQVQGSQATLKQPQAPQAFLVVVQPASELDSPPPLP